MPHESENPLIIDVVGEVEPADSADQRNLKKADRSSTKKSFFKRDKSSSSTTATQAASEADVNAAKRAAVAAAVPPVQGPDSKARTVQREPVQPVQQEQPPQVAQAAADAADSEAQPFDENDPIGASATSDVEVQVEEQASGVAPSFQDISLEASSDQSAPQPFVSEQQPTPVQPSAQPVAQPSAQPVAQPSAQPVEPPQAQPLVQPQPPQTSQPSQSAQSAPVQPEQAPAQPAPVQPAQPVPSVVPGASGFAPMPVVPPVAQGNMAAATADQPKTRAFFVFGILAAVAALLVLACIGFYSFYQFNGQTLLAPTSQVDQDAGEVKPIVSASLDQASKVMFRAKADNWTEEGSTPAIAYIKCVENDADDDFAERYFAFAPSQSASISLPAGRYAVSFIPPMNSDGSIYSAPDMIDVVVGDGGMAVLPVDFTLIPKDDVTEEQVSRTLAQLKTASEKGGDSFEKEPFKKSIQLALTSWFPQDDAADHRAADLTKEQQDSLNAQADSKDDNASGAAEHTHDWVAQHEQRWSPSVVPVIDAVAWESPVYARYRCQEGILFETLDACLAHVKQRGNEPYAESNEIIRVDYHPAVVHYEERGTYEDVITGYLCSICGAHGML